MMEKIKHPAHYAEGRKYEPYKVIKDWDLNFNLGNAVKYLSRAGRKDNAVVDLKKAIEYIQFELEAIEGEQENTTEPVKDFYEDSCCGECGCHKEPTEVGLEESLNKFLENVMSWIESIPYNFRSRHFASLRDMLNNLEQADKVRGMLSDRLSVDTIKLSKHSEPVSVQVIVEGGYISTADIDEVASNIVDHIRKSLRERAGMRDEDN